MTDVRDRFRGMMPGETRTVKGVSEDDAQIIRSFLKGRYALNDEDYLCRVSSWASGLPKNAFNESLRGIYSVTVRRVK